MHLKIVRYFHPPASFVNDLVFSSVACTFLLSHTFPFSFPVNKPTGITDNGKKPTQDTSPYLNTVTYILGGIAFILLMVLSIFVGFWCYRKSHQKRKKRLVSYVFSLDRFRIALQQTANLILAFTFS